MCDIRMYTRDYAERRQSMVDRCGVQIINGEGQKKHLRQNNVLPTKAPAAETTMNVTKQKKTPAATRRGCLSNNIEQITRTNWVVL